MNMKDDDLVSAVALVVEDSAPDEVDSTQDELPSTDGAAVSDD
jgi:hypothetical protein